MCTPRRSPGALNAQEYSWSMPWNGLTWKLLAKRQRIRPSCAGRT